MSPSDGGDDGRGLVERAIKVLLGSAPHGWAQLHVECVSAGAASAYVGVAGAGSQWLAVPPEAAHALSEYLVKSTGSSPVAQRLVVDCFSDGRLSARTEPAADIASVAASTLATPRKTAWPKHLLVALTAACLLAAAVVFAFGWRWSSPPDADSELLPLPPPRQQQAFEVISAWFGALAYGDTTKAQALSCPHPTGYALNDLEAMQGGYQAGINYAEAIVGFDDSGGQVTAKVVYRTYPLTEEEKRDVGERQRTGNGLTYRQYVLSDAGDGLKVCGGE